MQGKTEIITPEYAKQVLEKNPNNRIITAARVELYARDMKEGRWINNGQPIIFSPDGTLLDGQHRMHAVIASRSSVGMFVVRGVDNSAFVTMDSGKPRTLKDVLHIEGEPNAALMMNVARAAWNYASGISLRSSPSRSVLHDFVKAHPNMARIAAMVNSDVKKTAFPKAPLAAVLFLAGEAGYHDAEIKEFIDGVATGQRMWKGDPRLTLREWASIQRSKGARGARSDLLFGAAAKAWNAYAKGNELLRIIAVENNSRGDLPITGYTQEAFPDVPDIGSTINETRTRNLQEGRRLANIRKAMEKRARAIELEAQANA